MRRSHWFALTLRLPPEAVRQRFTDPGFCHDRLVAARWPMGVTCPRCGAQPCWFLAARAVFTCPAGHQFSPTSGTALHRSHLPLTVWFAAAMALILGHQRFSTLLTGRALAAQLGISYSAAHRLRRSLVTDLENNGLICRALFPTPPFPAPPPESRPPE